MTTQAQPYTLLNALNNGTLAARYAQERDALIELVPKLSPVRAGTLVAAYLAELMFGEWGVLEYAVHKASEESDETRLYDALEDRSFTLDLVDMSGSRTILADVDIINQESARGFLLSDALLHIAERETQA